MFAMTYPTAQSRSWLGRLAPRRSKAAASTLMQSRIDVRPPELWPSSLSWRGRFTRWLNAHASWLPSCAQPGRRLNRIRDDFLDSLQDLPGERARPLVERIVRARSLRELWHLRTHVYTELAMTIHQSEAERRLAELNRHFRVRTARGRNPGPVLQ